ncbi:MAG: GAF domain-containing protein, partial [Saprospiraceae bacterium]|nr:GAF domain-containing protein [Saprospiraceae bacterium]
ENLRLTQQTEQALAETADQARRLALLNEASSKLSAATQEDEIIQVAVNYTSRLFDTPDATLSLLNQTTEMLEVYGMDEVTGRVTPKQTLPANQREGTATSTAMKRGELLYIPDLRQDQHIESGQLAAMGLRSSLLAPLTTWHGSLGTLNVASPEVNAFSGARQQNLMVQFAALLVATIEERRLLAAVQSQAEKERVVNQISQRIQSTLTMEEALQTAVAELGSALQAHYTKVELDLSVDENDNGTAQHIGLAA